MNEKNFFLIFFEWHPQQTKLIKNWKIKLFELTFLISDSFSSNFTGYFRRKEEKDPINFAKYCKFTLKTSLLYICKKYRHFGNEIFIHLIRSARRMSVKIAHTKSTHQANVSQANYRYHYHRIPCFLIFSLSIPLKVNATKS